jgi:protein TonB
MNNLNPEKIYSMSVLKGEKAIGEYGEKASSGAIKVVLKKEQIIEVTEKDYSNAEDVPFAIIEEVPVFPGCTGTKSELKACLNKNLRQHAKVNFNKDLAQTLNLEPGRKKVYIQFKILKNGGVEIIGARAPHPKLEVEARRVVNLIPKMTPGKQGGKPVKVTYMLPISLSVE